MAWKWNVNAILSLASPSQRSRESAERLIGGMYPLFSTDNTRFVNYLTVFTPLRGTSFEYMLESIYTGGK